MFENVIMYEELQKIVLGCDVITYFDCAYAISVISDGHVHDVYVYDTDKQIKQWSFVGEFDYHDWRKLHKFIDTLKSIRHPFETDGSLKNGYVPF